jgi:hypothetical protein
MLAVYGRLLRMYPPSFRARFGEEMLQLVRDEATHGRRVPWVRTFADLLGSAFIQRWEMKNMRSNWWLVPFGVLLAFGATFMVVGSAFSVATLLVLLAELGVAGLIIGAAMLIGRRGSLGAEHDYAGRRFRWWWVPAGLIGAAEVTMITAQLIREPKGTNLFAFALISTFAALVFGGLATKNRRRGNIMIAIGVAPVMALFWSIVPPILALLVIVMALSDNARMSSRPQAAV